MESVEDFWGICLDFNNKKVEWKGAADMEAENDIEQSLELRQACLGLNTKDERNIVNVTTENGFGDQITQTILSMKTGLHEQTQLFLTLQAPATFELVSGNGPLYISGTVTSVMGGEPSDEEDEEEEEEEEEEEIEEEETAADMSTGKKRPATSPVQKAAKAIKVEKKDGTKTAVSTKPGQKLANKDDGSDDEEDEDEEDGEDNEMESEISEEEESRPTIVKKQGKVKPQQKGGNGPQKKQPQTGVATPKSAGGKESAKKQGKEALTMDEVKERLLKTPTAIPKKMDKFNNYITNSFKITDEKVKKQLWEFVQKNRPIS